MSTSLETQALKEHPLTLTQIVERAYQVFANCPTPDRLINYGGPYRDYELETAMCQAPLRTVSAPLFYSYFMEPSPDRHSHEEFLYFLPRILDLLAQGETVHFALELALANLKRCPADALSASAIDVLDGFALAFFKNHLGPNQWLKRWAFQHDDPIVVLAMAHLAGLTLQPLLAWWAQTDDPKASQHFVELGYFQWWGPEAAVNAFVEDDPVFLSQLQAWLTHVDTRARFREKLKMPAFQHLADTEPRWARASLREMADVALRELSAPRAWLR